MGNGFSFVILPSNLDELVDQIKLVYFEKVGGNDNPHFNEQTIAITNKLQEYECITTNQHQNITSISVQKGSAAAIKILYTFQIPYKFYIFYHFYLLTQ